MEVCSLLLISRRRESLGTFPGSLTAYSSRQHQTAIQLDQCSFLRQTVTLYHHGRPLSLHLYYFTSFSQKETCANRKHQMVRYSQPQVHPPQRNLDLQVPMLMPLAHSYFSLKVEYCDLENVFKSTAIFDHFYDHMVTFFLMWKYIQKKTLVMYECTCIQLHQIQSLAMPFVSFLSWQRNHLKIHRKAEFLWGSLISYQNSPSWRCLVKYC